MSTHLRVTTQESVDCHYSKMQKSIDFYGTKNCIKIAQFHWSPSSPFSKNLELCNIPIWCNLTLVHIHQRKGKLTSSALQKMSSNLGLAHDKTSWTAGTKVLRTKVYRVSCYQKRNAIGTRKVLCRTIGAAFVYRKGETEKPAGSQANKHTKTCVNWFDELQEL